MKTTTIMCDRCSGIILGGHAIVRIEAGELAKRFAEPVDLCGSCAERFSDWLRSGRRR